jgi:hypothetical protein
MTMIDAKNKFREGYIMLLRPFDFAELRNPLQKLTILWAYSEQPITKKILKPAAREQADLIENSAPMFMLGGKEAKENWIEIELERLFDQKESWEMLYEGEVVQCTVEGQTCRFYPDEYRIMDKERLFEIMQEEGYHTIIANELKEIKEFKDKVHYLQSRGVKKNIAEKWSTLAYGPMVMYKPYYELLDMFCRSQEIYKDSFYEEIEGIIFDN